MESRIDYNYAHFDFNYIWLRDKQIVVKGDQYAGMLVILDDRGNPLKWYGYELISKYDEDETKKGWDN
jgi:hypothetical protein